MNANAVQSHEQEVPAGVLPDNATEQQLLEYYNPDLPDFDTIGEDPTTHGQAVAYLTRLAREAHGQDWDDRIEQARSNAVVYEKSYDPAPGPNAVTANEIQDIVLTITDIETRNPMPVFIRPVETRDKARVFWIGPPVDDRLSQLTGLPLGLGMQQVQVPITSSQTGQPMTDQMGQPAMAMQQQPMPQGGFQELDEVTAFIVRKIAAGGAFPTEWLCILDDNLVADVYQTIFDLMWEESSIDEFMYSNVLMTNIYGFQTAWYGWDSLKKKHIVENLSIKQVFLDRTRMELDRMSYMMFDLVMDINRAKVNYPQLTSLIDHYAIQGSPSRIDSETNFGVADDQAFYRRTVTIRTAFMADQLVSMTQAEAEERGLMFTQPGETQPQLSDAGWMHTTGKDAQGNLAEDGTLPDGQWPKTVGIRQMATLNQCARIVQDIRCEHAVSPILLNVCIPIPSLPYGQGIPEKLKSMQRADIELLSALVKYAQTFSNPGCAIPESVAQALKGGLGRTHVDPSETLIFPDLLIQKFGKDAVMWFQPPPMPPAVPLAMQQIKDRVSSTSGRTEALQGEAPTPNASGVLVEALQNAGASKFGFQSQWTRKMKKRLATLMHYTHLWRLDIADVMKIYSRLPQPIMEMVIEKARNNKWDLSTDVSDGSSSEADKKLNRAIKLNSVRSATGEPALSMTSLREQAGLDAEQESIRWKEESGTGGLQPQVQPQQQTQPQPAGRMNGNGNGFH